MGLFAVFPLALLLFTGLYLFVLPYGAKWRSGPTGLNGRPHERPHRPHTDDKADQDEDGARVRALRFPAGC